METRFTNEKGYGLSVAVWLADDEYDHSPVEGKYISVTGMLKPIRMIVLDQRAQAVARESGQVDVIDIDRFVASQLGTAIHSGIEHSWTRVLGKNGQSKRAYEMSLRKLGFPKETVSKVRVNPTEEELAENPDIIPIYMEQRAFKKVGTYTVGGKFDFVGDGVLEDFKSMGVWPFMKGDKDPEQILQGSLYRWLNPVIITEDYMRIQQILTDWSKMEARMKINRGYPQLRIVEKTLALMSYNDTEKWVREKIKVIESFEKMDETKLPRCTTEELWQTPPEYKVHELTAKKVLSKNAKATYDNYPEAQAHAMKTPGAEVREKTGMIRRCGYCAAFDLCTQKDEYLVKNMLQMP